jgi:transcription factor E
MRIELLKEIVHFIIGEKSKGIVELLAVKKNVNEFIIAKKLGLTINQTRNLLYKLSDEGLVSVIRKKNKKKGGWYDHFWTLNFEKALLKFQEILIKNIEQAKQQIEIKKKERFYYCETCKIEVNEEQALLQEYTCLECGQILGLKDSTKEIVMLSKHFAQLEKNLSEVKSELLEIQQKEVKLKARREAVEQMKKAKERAAKRLSAKKHAAREKAAKAKKLHKHKKKGKPSHRR